jgi:hypothetical protein
VFMIRSASTDRSRVVVRKKERSEIRRGSSGASYRKPLLGLNFAEQRLPPAPMQWGGSCWRGTADPSEQLNTELSTEHLEEATSTMSEVHICKAFHLLLCLRTSRDPSFVKFSRAHDTSLSSFAVI